MRLEFENPYASPRDLEFALIAAPPRRTDVLRGLTMSFIWLGAGYAAILLIASLVRIVVDVKAPLVERIKGAIWFLPFFSDAALFFGVFFALAALASYTPALRTSFGRTVLYVLASLIPWTSILLVISLIFRYPFRYDPLSYLVTPIGQWWVAGWLMLGPIGFTIYLLWRRTSAR